MARWPVSKVSANIKSQELRAKSRNSLSKVFSRIPFSMAMGEWSPQTRSHVHIFVSPLRAFVHVITTFTAHPTRFRFRLFPKSWFLLWVWQVHSGDRNAILLRGHVCIFMPHHLCHMRLCDQWQVSSFLHRRKIFHHLGLHLVNTWEAQILNF